MREYLDAVNRYIKDSTWQDLLAVKVCLCAIGVLIGLMMPFRKKWIMAWIASLVFVGSYIPVMGKFLPHLLGEKIAIEDIYKSDKKW